jgi:peptide deformylase
LAILRIYHWNDPLLTTKSAAVTEVTAELKKFIEDMFETMYAAPGIGLAANQVGRSLRVMVYDEGYALAREKNEKPINNPKILINPIIITAEGSQTFNEGCLSHPGFDEEITRPSKITILAKDIRFKKIELMAEGFLATVLQHEMDHLNGVRVMDRVSRLKRSLYIKQYNKEHNA